MDKVIDQQILKPTQEQLNKLLSFIPTEKRSELLAALEVLSKHRFFLTLVSDDGAATFSHLKEPHDRREIAAYFFERWPETAFALLPLARGGN